MRSPVWISAALVVVGMALAPSSLPSATALSELLGFWWSLPLVASSFSLLVLGAAAAVRYDGDAKIRGSISTKAYLVIGPSYGVTSILPWLSVVAAPPAWVESLMLLLLFSSAGVYYANSRDPEEDLGTQGRNTPAWMSAS